MATEHIRSMGREYHIGLKKGELSEYILLCGDPERAEIVADKFSSVNVERKHREFITYTGIWNGINVSVMSTGIGPDNTEIAVIESLNITKRPTFIRVGSCGGLKKNIKVGDIVISTGAVRLENTSSFFVPDGYPAIAHHEVISALIYASMSLGVKYHVGITATAPGFYGAQGRNMGIPLMYPDIPGDMARVNVLNMEMESSVLFVLASIMGLRAGTVCAVYADRYRKEFINSKEMLLSQKKCIDVALNAIVKLEEVKNESR